MPINLQKVIHIDLALKCQKLQIRPLQVVIKELSVGYMKVDLLWQCSVLDKELSQLIRGAAEK